MVAMGKDGVWNVGLQKSVLPRSDIGGLICTLSSNLCFNPNATSRGEVVWNHSTKHLKLRIDIEANGATGIIEIAHQRTF